MQILCETDELILEHSYELVQLRSKPLDVILFKDEFYGDSSCGLIGQRGEWAFVGGFKVSIWAHNKLVDIHDKEILPVHSARQKQKYTVEILVDPWSEFPSVWELNILTMKKEKIRDFNEYRNKPYSEIVNW